MPDLTLGCRKANVKADDSSLYSRIQEGSRKRFLCFYDEMVRKYGVEKVKCALPTNCTTWALDKLHLADIALEDSKTRFIATLPIQYTSKV